MNKLYILLFVVVGYALVYCAGIWHGNTRCQKSSAQNAVQVQANLIKKQERINEETVISATDSIRRFLHKKYTIAQ